ncbi:ABC transporter substrate-binding protein [Paenibacillus elgii]|uniref:ABC transporter substrate-binding protein n=1 Tax=Paenibacillus elgii TaxID=189691 RepID=A0A161SDG0_9BACL|nr:BMP family ABC transporter substrate-binding protein [Paenibacillus elgii]KZE84418.1 ABC transporter substrate-binding protein [Paenibacillus elgii]
MKRKGRQAMMRWISLLVSLWLLAGCAQQAEKTAQRPMKIGIMLSEVGLGDQSFSDAAFQGLIKARDEQGIVFDYREIAKTKTYDAGFEQLAQDGCDLVIGLGFMIKESLEKAAKQHPDRQFIIVDETSDLPNVASITFKEEEGSFLAGAIAGLTTRSNVVGFVGGADVPLIHKFQNGFEQGVKAVNPKAEVTAAYAGDFGNAALGVQIAGGMIDKQKVDVLYSAAGFTGVGALQEAAKRGKYGIGVDTDQFFVAEKAVVTSMLKNIDVAIDLAVKSFVQNSGRFPQKHMVFGLKENGVGLAPIRVISLQPEQQQKVDDLIQKLVSGSITIPTP